MKILLVEDDPDLAAAIRLLLERQKHVVDLADSLGMARAALLDYDYALVLLDRRLPDGEGTDLIRHARQHRIQTRFLVLSALGGLHQRVDGLDLGADDYMVKPFEPEELLARVRAAERRPLPETDKVLELGNLHFHCASRNFQVAGETAVLPRRELIVLESLMRAAGRVVTRDYLDEAVYGYDEEIQSNSLESHISRLRKRLAGLNAGVAIHTIRGVGYMLKAQAP